MRRLKINPVHFMTYSTIQITQVRKMAFGRGCLSGLAEDVREKGLKRLLILTIPAVLANIRDLIVDLEKENVEVSVDSSILREPAFSDFERLIEHARSIRPDGIIGIGGGSVLDISKLVAAQLNNTQALDEVVGIGKLQGRNTFLACIPTTSGTGSEVSPNAILLDEKEQLKKGVVSPYLVPDAVYIDPLITRSVPPQITAATGLDAFTHCIEAYANKFAQPLIDVYALEGVRLISSGLVEAVKNGKNMAARSDMALGSLLGGLCLGPVNTAAIHALSYPLGSRFHIAHGLSNALLMPHVIRFNLPAAPERYAGIARAMGCRDTCNPMNTAREGLFRMEKMIADCDVPRRLSEINIPEGAIETMAEDALKITRLLKNNVRELSMADAVAIYKAAY